MMHVTPGGTRTELWSVRGLYLWPRSPSLKAYDAAGIGERTCNVSTVGVPNTPARRAGGALRKDKSLVCSNTTPAYWRESGAQSGAQ
jgi:hypothetical protein